MLNDYEFVLLVKRQDEILERLMELEKKFEKHKKYGDICPHTGR